MDKSDFCVHLIREVDELKEFVRINASLFYDGITEENFHKVDGNHYFPPHTAQCLAIGNIHVMLLCISSMLHDLHENVLFPEYKF